MKPSFTIGIEEEYQTIDPETRDLRSHIDMEIIAKGKVLLKESVKPEMHQSVIEVGTGVCNDIEQARGELIGLRRDMIQLAKNGRLRLAAGRHASIRRLAQAGDLSGPALSRHRGRHENCRPRESDFRIARARGHRGSRDRHPPDERGALLPAAILALSTNSPFWLGMDTGLKSYRCKVFDKFPRTNIPDYFPSWGEYESFVNLLVQTKCIDNAKKIWWDIRPHPHFQTLEFRICDIPMRVEETLAIAALIQATVAKLYKLHAANQGFRLYRRALIMENKWRAVRYGLDGKLIDFGKRIEVPVRDLIYEYLHLVDDVVDELRSRREINYIHKILEMGTGADRQLRVFKETGDLTKVVDYMISETENRRRGRRTKPRPISPHESGHMEN